MKTSNNSIMLEQTEQAESSSGSMVDATINQSSAHSLPTAAHSNCRSGAYHMSAHVIWQQYQQLKRPVPVGAKETRFCCGAEKYYYVNI